MQRTLLPKGKFFDGNNKHEIGGDPCRRVRSRYGRTLHLGGGGGLSRARLQLACPEIHPKGKSTRGSSRGLTMLLTGPQHRSEVVWALALYLIEWGPCRPKCVVAAWRVQHLRENLGSRRLSARHAFDTALKLLLDHPGISSRQSSIDGTIPGKQL